MTTLKLAICGHGGSGKDTAAEILAEMSTLRYFAGSSKFAADIVWERWGQHLGFWKNVQECWNDRREYREEWARVIGDHNRLDPVQLYRDCLADQEILTGIRWLNELKACRTAGIVDLWIWIDREVPTDPTMTFGADQCDIVLPNHGSKAQLKLRLYALARALGVLKHA